MDNTKNIHTRHSMKYVPAKHTYKIYKIDFGKTYIQDIWIILQDIHTRQ